MPKQLHPSTLPPATYESADFSTPSSTLVFAHLLIAAVLAGVKRYLTAVLSLTVVFPMTNDIEYLFMDSLGIFKLCMLLLSIRNKTQIYKYHMIPDVSKMYRKNVFRKHTKISMVIVSG